MISLICLFFPAMIGCLVWEKLYPEKRDTFHRIGRYVSFTLIINCILFLCLMVVSSSTDGMMTYLNQINAFVVEYIVVSVVLACALPYIFRFMVTKVSLQIKKPEWEKRIDIPWRMISFIYAVLIFLMNFVRVFDENFWGDEGYSIKLANMHLTKMFQATASDVHPPLYYMFMIVVNRLFGDCGWAYHLLSVLPLLFMLGFALTIVWKRFGKEASFLFITLAGMSSQAVVYNAEVRMYSWASLFVLLSFWSLFSIMNKKKYAEFLFVIYSLAAAYTHYYALLSVAFFYLAILLLVLMKKYSAKRLLMVYCFTILGYLPWVVQMFLTFKRTSQNFWLKEIPGFSQGMRFYFESTAGGYSILIWGIMVVACIVIIFRETKIVRVQKEDEKYCIHIFDNLQGLSTDTIWIAFGLMAGVGTLVVGEAVSILIRPVFMLRYLYPVASVVWLVLCVVISKLHWRQIIGTAVVIISVVSFLPDYFELYISDRKMNVQCVATWNEMNEMISENDILLTNAVFLNWTLLDYYFPQNEHAMITDQSKSLEPGKQYWLVWYDELNGDDEKWLEINGLEAEERICEGFIGYETVHVYQLK